MSDRVNGQMLSLVFNFPQIHIGAQTFKTHPRGSSLPPRGNAIREGESVYFIKIKLVYRVSVAKSFLFFL